jgi:phosphoesterase RecJ-like protein
MGNIEKFEQLYCAIKAAKTAAIVGHVRPDGDSVGCSVAMRLALVGLGYRHVDMFVDGEIPETFDYMSESRNFNKPTLPTDNKYDLLFILDSSDISRLGKCSDLTTRAQKIIVIDHHLGTSFDADLIISDSKRASAGEILFDFFESHKIKITRDIATALYTSISSDTGCFLFPCTSSYSHSVATKLLGYGIDLESIHYRNFRVVDPRNFGGLVYVLKKCKFFHNGKISLVCFPAKIVKKYKVDDQMRHRFQKFASDVIGVRISAFITGVDRRTFNVSLRSHGDANVAQIASGLGGGGHKNASGFTAKGRLRDVARKTVKAIQVYLADFESNEN